MEHNAVRLSKVNFSVGFWNFKKYRITGPPERQRRIRPFNAMRRPPAYAATSGVQTFGKAFVYRQRAVRFDQTISAACRECIGKMQNTLHPFSPVSEIPPFQIGIGFKRRNAKVYEH